MSSTAPWHLLDFLAAWAQSGNEIRCAAHVVSFVDPALASGEPVSASHEEGRNGSLRNVPYFSFRKFLSACRMAVSRMCVLHGVRRVRVERKRKWDQEKAPAEPAELL